MSKDKRSGGKFTGSHTTCIPLAARVVDIAAQSTLVSKIALGFIKNGIGTTDHRKVKITDGEGSLLLSIRDNATHQEVRVYVSHVQEARTEIARSLRGLDIGICFK